MAHRGIPLDELRNLAADPSAAGSAKVEAALADVARVQSWVAAREAALLTRAAELAAAGKGADPEDAMRKNQRTSSSEGRKKAKRARAAAKAPALADSLGNGSATPGHLDALANAATGLEPDHADALFDAANNVATDAERLSVEAWRRQLDRLIDKIRKDEGLDRDAEQRRSTSLRKWINRKSGMYVVNAEFHPELGEQLFGRIDAEVERLWRQSTAGATDSTLVPDSARRNDSLAAHALVSLASAGHSGACSSVPEVVVFVDDRTIESGIHDQSVSETSLGSYLPPDTIRRMCCDARITPVHRGADGDVLNIGRSARTANRAQRRALRSMYRSCAFDGCTKPFDWCEIHHVVPWSEFGPTDLDNLIPLCHQHHHTVHEGRWQLKLLPDRTLKIFRPDGRHFSTVPPARLVDAPPGDAPTRPPDREPQPA